MSQRLRELLGGKGKKEKALSDVGVSTIADKKTEERIRQYKELAESIQSAAVLPRTKTIEVQLRHGEKKPKQVPTTPEDLLEAITKNLHLINQKLHEIAIPWMRAGDKPVFSEAVSGWSKIYSEYSDIVATVRQMMKKEALLGHNPARSKEELINKFHTFFVTIYLRYAQLMHDISFMGTDVTQAWNLTVYQPPVPTSPRVDLAGLGTGGEESGVKQEDV